MSVEEPTSSAIEAVLPISELGSLVEGIWQWVNSTLLVPVVGAQIIAIIAAIVPAMIFGPRLRLFLNAQVVERTPAGRLRSIVQAAAVLALPIALY